MFYAIPPNVFNTGVNTTDQFGAYVLNTTSSRYLGVPSKKLDVEIAAIPAASEWGLAILALIVTVVGTVVILRRRAAAA